MYGEIRKTSFGFMTEVEENGVKVELLEFHRSGRPHKYKEAELFTVTKGVGFLIVENEESPISKGGEVLYRLRKNTLYEAE